MGKRRKRRLKKNGVLFAYTEKISLATSILGVLIAFASFILAYQANVLAKQVASAEPSILKTTFPYETLMITGCQTKNKDYHLDLFVANELIIANKGGKDTTLTKVSLSRDDQVYGVYLYPSQVFDARFNQPDMDFYHGMVYSRGLFESIVVPTDAERIDLPVIIKSGTGEKWLFQGEFHYKFSDLQDAEKQLAEIDTAGDYFDWVFEFSDGTTLTSQQFIVSYSKNPNLFLPHLICE